MDSKEILVKKLKKLRIIADADKAAKEIVGERVKLKQDTDLFVRDSILGLGTVLEENLEKHYYITSIELGGLGKVLCYAIILREGQGSFATLQVYGREGLIKRNLAPKALEKLKQALS